jgi:hypothetical protein
MGKKPSGNKQGLAYLADRVLCVDLSDYSAMERNAVVNAIRERMGNQLHIERLSINAETKLLTCDVVVSSSRHKDSTPESARKTAGTLVRQVVEAHRVSQRTPPAVAARQAAPRPAVAARKVRKPRMKPA